MNFQNHKFKVIGVLPLLTHNPSSMGGPSTGPKTRKIPTPEEEAAAGAYRDDKGNFCIPSVAFRSAFLGGLRNKRVGKSSAISVFQAAVLTVDELTVLVDQKTRKPLKKYVIDSRRAVIQRSGVIRSRPGNRTQEPFYKVCNGEESCQSANEH